MGRVVHFEIHVDDVDRASKFYKDIFDWEFNKWEGGDYWLIKTGEDGTPGINGGMMPRRDPQGNVYNTIQVDNLDEAMQKVQSSGGQIVLEKMGVPKVGWMAYGKDTEGNIFGMMQFDPNVK
jgi:predicted enzyme related to lactoylglutathione lyase